MTALLRSTCLPDISVVVTAYNRCHLLPRALESLLTQTLRNWEAVVVDDGSVDGTGELMEIWQKRDMRFRYFRQENTGLALARNAGLRAARADLLTFLDSDDEYEPSHLELRLEHFRSRPELDIIHGGLRVVGGPDWVPDRFDPTRRIALENCFVGGTFVMRRRLFQALGGFRQPDYGDDYDFMTRAIAAGFQVGYVEAPTYIYHRETPDGMCNVLARQHTCEQGA